MSETKEHPAELLDQYEFDITASYAADQLELIGFTYARLSPRDGTAYDICIIRPPMISQWDRFKWNTDGKCEFNDENRYFVSHSIGGQLYGWGGGPMHHDYVHEKWTRGNKDTDVWTARVIARFLTALSKAIGERKQEGG